MCGLTGFVNLDAAPADAGVASAMLRAVAHRGPDDHDQLLLSLRRGTIGPGADTAIGFHRLKILDLSDRGRQPMVNPSGTVALALNGEVYNAFDYQAELEAAGYRFRSRTDTEIVLYLYERYGIDGLLDRLDGMFAMAIADLRAPAVHLVRDPFGIKPLYWTQAGQAVLFASETKAFLAHPSFIAEVDDSHVDEQLAFRYVAGDASLLKRVHQLRPGHRATITMAGVTVRRYGSQPAPARAVATLAESVAALEPLLRQSVASQLRSDVPVGCQLSGGIDSSLVAAFGRSSKGLDACSVVFEDPKFSEAPWIDAAAAVAGARSHPFLFTESAFMAPLERAAWHMDQPISHPNALGIWWLAHESRQRGVPVLLSGEGADEVFGGYDRFRTAHTQPVDAVIRATQLQPDSKLARLRPGGDLAPAIARRAAIFAEGSGDRLANVLHYERQTYLADLLVRQDKMTMAHGVENRVPFLDRRLVDFAGTLAAEHLVNGETTKVVLKALAAKTFSNAFAYRPKAAFALPLSQYFRSRAFTELMEDRLLPGMRARGLVSEPAVRQLWRRSLSAPALTEVCWLPVALELWAGQFVDRPAAQLSA